MRRINIALAALCLAALGACGQKGPLKLPEPPKAAAAASVAP